MNKKIYASLIMLGLTLAALIAPAASAQTRTKTTAATTTTTQAPAANALLPTLPASDVAMFVDVQKLLNDALPRALAEDKPRLAQINADIDSFKTRYGLDVRTFDRVAVGLRFISRSPTVVTTDIVALAQGRFNAPAMIAAARIAMKGKYQEQKYAGQTIYTFSVNDRMKWLGLLNMRVSDISVAALDAQTLALGDLDVVRAAVDAHKGRGRIGGELVQLATRNPNAILGFAANVPPSVAQSSGIDNEEISRSIASIRQAYGSIGTTATGFDMLMVAHTEKPEQARSLNDSLAALRQFSGFLIAQLPADKGKLAQSVIDNLKVTTEGSDLQIRLEIAQTDIASLVRIF
ncbi:MAG TPA: hypothetical protein VGX92_12840 [Pyrinomonadaceae bacterium]|nr:hypothetical protein [Pyrinomonadaceae bacterium]